MVSLRVLYCVDRSRLSTLNEKLTGLERKVDYLQAKVSQGNEEEHELSQQGIILQGTTPNNISVA